MQTTACGVSVQSTYCVVPVTNYCNSANTPQTVSTFSFVEKSTAAGSGQWQQERADHQPEEAAKSGVDSSCQMDVMIRRMWLQRVVTTVLAPGKAAELKSTVIFGGYLQLTPPPQ